jgi:signal transduction histidine kinase
MLAPLACAVLSIILLAAIVHGRRTAIVSARRLSASQARQQDLVRLLRLTASELRGPALALVGHAEQLPPETRALLVGVCRGLLDIAEGILDETDDPNAKRRLREETIRLAPLVGFVVAQVDAQLGPGRRDWRIAPGLDGMVLRADRRALHQVLLRVLSSAALATGDGDPIDIATAQSNGGLTLRIEDEGAGLAVGSVHGDGVETRGLGLGLSLARSLMHAHGGSLAVESASLVGTRVLLSFPCSRVIADG